jgi:hypothetical protein
VRQPLRLRSPLLVARGLRVYASDLSRYESRCSVADARNSQPPRLDGKRVPQPLAQLESCFVRAASTPTTDRPWRASSDESSVEHESTAPLAMTIVPTKFLFSSLLTAVPGHIVAP